jgi:hypothetical protein
LGDGFAQTTAHQRCARRGRIGRCGASRSAAARREDALTLEIPNRKPIALQQIARDVFVASYLGVVRFSRDTKDTVTGLVAHSPGVRALGFEHVR